MSADRTATVVFDEAVGGLGLAHRGSGRPGSGVGIEAAELTAAVPAAATARIAGLPEDEPA
ncbi:hypothetical protein [Streptomyces sp. NPDC002599]|uniref:hypothetical protein n=1 Tax=Streptomyces sp. NPDC002599 TaxID=3154421 RepID=UPI00331D49A0